jgi:hypothetical protein
LLISLEYNVLEKSGLDRRSATGIRVVRSANNLNLNFTTKTLQAAGGDAGGTWYYGIPNEKFGRRVLEMTLRYNF